MLDARGAGGGTDWASMSVDMMHTLIRNPDTDAHYEIIDGWKKSAELVSQHMSQVQDYRNALAAAWPPEKSPASATYLSRLDDLIGTLHETYEAALANHDALASATLSISLAQTAMDKIYSQWQTNDQLLAQFSAKQQQPSTTPTPSPTPSGDEPPPVTAAQQEALRQRAITLMSGVSTDLAQAQLKIVQPKLYDGATPFGDKTTPVDPGVSQPPVIPPITPIAMTGGTISARTPHIPTAFPGGAATPAVSTGPTGGGTQHPGLVLGGLNTPLTPPPTSGASPMTPPSPLGTSGPPGGTTVLPPSPSTLLPGSPLTKAGGGSPVRQGLATPGLGRPEGRAMPPGGMIGGSPGAGLGQPARSAGAQRINPIGGVIGEGVRAGRPTGAARLNATRGQPFGQVGARRSGAHDDSEPSHWDPDNPWHVEEGVVSVVLPAEEPRFDPGPAIGLH